MSPSQLCTYMWGQVHLKTVQNLSEKVAQHFKVSPTNEREGGVGAIGRVTRLIFLVEIKAKTSLFGSKLAENLVAIRRAAGAKQREGITDWARTFALPDGNCPSHASYINAELLVLQSVMWMQAENVNNVSLEIAGYPNLFQGSTAWQRWRERVGMRNEIKGESQNEIF